MKRTNSGFSAIEALLVVVVAGLIGLVGWHVLQAMDKGKSSQGSSTRIETTKPAKLVDETANWTKVTAGKSSFTIKVPDGWNLQNWTSRDYLYASSYKDVTYSAGKAAVVTSGDTFPIDSGPVRHFDITGNPISEKSSVGYYFNETSQDFVSGVQGKKYIHTYPEDVDGVKKGDKVYLYRFEGKKTLITINYYVLSGENDQSALVEKAIKTLSFE